MLPGIQWCSPCSLRVPIYSVEIVPVDSWPVPTGRCVGKCRVLLLSTTLRYMYLVRTTRSTGAGGGAGLASGGPAPWRHGARPWRTPWPLLRLTKPITGVMASARRPLPLKSPCSWTAVPKLGKREAFEAGSGDENEAPVTAW